MNAKRTDILILGGGPAGLEAALAARAARREFVLLERGNIGASMCRWGHVRLFSSWELNTSARGRAVLTENNVPLPDPSVHPTGAEVVNQYLRPLAASPQLEPHIRIGVEAVAVGRKGTLKGDFIGNSARGDAPFRVLWRDTDGREGFIESRVLIDATGVYDHAAATGNGGVPAPGEAAAGENIERHIPDPLGTDRQRYAGRHTLVVGAGYSAATVLRDFATLVSEAPSTRVTWVLRSTREIPIAPIDDDPLPQRRALTALANEIASNPPPGIELVRGATVERIDGSGAQCRVTLSTPDGETDVSVDGILSLVGYRPDTSLLGELQVHLCYATDGLMKLSASLMSSSAASGDCLAVEAPSCEVLTSPEPNLFVIGSKSYGRFSHYLMRSGVEQVDAIFAMLDKDETST